MLSTVQQKMYEIGSHKCHSRSSRQAVQWHTHAIDMEEVEGDEPADGWQLRQGNVFPH